MFLCLLMYGCNKNPDSISFEGKSDNWTVFTSIPHIVEKEDKFIKVTFLCRSIEHLFSESDILSFSIGTSTDTVVYSYSKTDGYIRSEYASDMMDFDRIIHVSDDTFEVYYDINIIETINEAEEQRISIQVADDKIELLPVE